MRSLHGSGRELAKPENQLALLETGAGGHQERFRDRLEAHGRYPLTPLLPKILQVNVGYMCNQVCRHCHVDAGPDRREVMSRATMTQCLDVLRRYNITTLDITGGAPEMNPDFRWFVSTARAAGVSEIIVRSNLTILVSNPSYRELPAFFRQHHVRVCSSLPYYDAGKTDRQRGEGVFARSVEALRLLNDEGYGREGSGLILDLVYNPSGAFLPGDQRGIERDFRLQLERNHNVVFNRLFTITNIPVSRFLDYLVESGNYEEYMEKLIASFNPLAVDGLMCRDTVSVDWEGNLYDCDFNQMLGLKMASTQNPHISDYSPELFSRREIVTGQHCFACTAGAGSSCQGATTTIQ